MSNNPDEMVTGALKMDHRFIHKKVGVDEKNRPILQMQPNVESPGFGELILKGVFITIPKRFVDYVDTEAEQPVVTGFEIMDKQEDPDKNARMITELGNDLIRLDRNLESLSKRIASLEAKPKMVTKDK